MNGAGTSQEFPKVRFQDGDGADVYPEIRSVDEGTGDDYEEQQLEEPWPIIRFPRKAKPALLLLKVVI